MNPERYQRIKKIFMQVIDAPASELDSLLDKYCQSDSQLKKEVQELIDLNIGDTFMAHSPIKCEIPSKESEILKGQIGRITINKLLARGGMGDVYSGLDTLLDRTVAIKIINQEYRMSAARRTAFLNEAKIISGLQHPNICQVYDFFEEENRDVLVLELINGQTLRDLLETSKVKTPLIYMLQICKALVAAHERGIIHQDLKPENIMLSTSNQIKILDFGIASSDNIKSAEGISGTLGYMSPEQAKGEITTTATDIYSLALIFIEILSGYKMFDSKEASFKLIEKSSKANIELPKSLPKTMSTLFTTMLNKKPSQRPSAREVLTKLIQFENLPKTRLRLFAIISVLAISTLATWKYTSDLKHERQLALSAKDQADSARNEAEDLVSFMLDDLNTGLQSVGRLDLMESVAEKVNSYYNQSESNLSNGQSAMALIRIAEVFDSQGKKKQAINALKQSILTLEKINETDPSNELILSRLGDANNALAEIYKITGDFKLSLNHSSRAWQIGKKLTHEYDPGFGSLTEPSGNKRWKVLLRAMYLNADVHMRSGKGLKAIEILNQARPQALIAVTVEPQLKGPLADIEYKLCDSMYDVGLDQEAIAPCLGILKLDKELFDSNPENYRLYSNYAVDHMTIGRLYIALNQYDKTIETMNEGIIHAEKIVKWDPSNYSSINDLALMKILKGIALIRLGDQQNGISFINQAEQLLLPLITDEEEITYLNNMFSIHLFLGRKEQAIPIAKNLSAKGFSRREFLELCVEFKVDECSSKEK